MEYGHLSDDYLQNIRLHLPELTQLIYEEFGEIKFSVVSLDTKIAFEVKNPDAGNMPDLGLSVGKPNETYEYKQRFPLYPQISHYKKLSTHHYIGRDSMLSVYAGDDLEAAFIDDEVLVPLSAKQRFPVGAILVWSTNVTVPSNPYLPPTSPDSPFLLRRLSDGRTVLSHEPVRLSQAYAAPRWPEAKLTGKEVNEATRFGKVVQIRMSIGWDLKDYT